MRATVGPNKNKKRLGTIVRPDLRLKRWLLAVYATPAAPMAALGLPIVVFLPVYYERSIGLDMAAVGLVFMLARFWDIFTDPIVGVLEDRTTLPFGRRRSWLAIGAPLTALGAILVFFPPETANVSYLIAAMFLLYVGFTVTQVAHLSWGAEIADTPDERSRVQGWREIWLVGGMLVVLATPSVLGLLNLGDFADGVRAMGCFVIVGLPLAALLVITLVPEPVRGHQRNLRWGEALPMIRDNRNLQVTLIADILTGFSAGVLGSLFVYYFESYLRFPDGQALLLLFFYFVSGLVAVPLWMLLSYRLGKARAFLFAMLASAVGSVLILTVPPGNFPVAIIVLLVAGIPYGAGPFLLRALTADISHDDRETGGSPRTGIVFSVLMMSSKLGLALAVGFTFVVMDAVGFNSDQAATNTPLALETLRYLFAGVPFLTFLLAALTIRFYGGFREKRDLTDA